MVYSMSFEVTRCQRPLVDSAVRGGGVAVPGSVRVVGELERVECVREGGGDMGFD